MKNVWLAAGVIVLLAAAWSYSFATAITRDEAMVRCNTKWADPTQHTKPIEECIGELTLVAKKKKKKTKENRKAAPSTSASSSKSTY
jgi:hypothetical protein